MFSPGPALSRDWGKVMTVTGSANIRADRHSTAKITGKLEAGEKVKADFPRGGWYAVFRLDEKDRNEKKALGYVIAQLLTNSDRHSQPPAGRPEEKAQAVAVVPDGSDEGIILRNITFKLSPGGHEKVYIALNCQVTPKLSSIQDASPRVIADFKNVASVRPGLQNIPVDGSMIKRIRSFFDPATHILRVVLDLDATKNYMVDQAFYEAEKVFVLDLSEDVQTKNR